MNTLIQDLRFALRRLRKSPAFTLTAIITLALGIGANTAIFTLVHGILLRSLPVADPAQLYRIGDAGDCCYNFGFQNDNGDFDIFSYDLYLHFKQSAPEFEQLAAVQAGPSGFSVRSGTGPAKQLQAEYVSGNYFETLGVGAFAGRTLRDSDDTPTATPALVISFNTWKADFGGDPGLVGSTVYVQTRPFIVTGIAPPGFFGDRISPRPPDIWIPLAGEPFIEGAGSTLLEHGDNTAWLYSLGRVHPGTNIGALQAKLSAGLRLWLTTRTAFTEHGGAAEIPKQHVVLSPGGGGIQNLQQRNRKALRMLMILSSFVLLIACANIANLLLARATTRRSEVAVRLAIGASRRRLVRQILTESVLLSLAGGVAGLAVAYAGSQMILALAFPNAISMPVQVSPSLPVLGFAFLVSFVTGVFFGSVPAWLLSHGQPSEALRGVNRSTHDRSSLPQSALVVFQVALSIALLTGAILMTKSLRNLEHQDLGLAVFNRYIAVFDPAAAGYTVERLPALYRQIEDRFSALPAMNAMSLAMFSPLQGGEWAECVIQQGHPAPGPNGHCGSTWDRVSTRFLDSIGVPVVRGRGFTDRDSATSPQVAIVNQAFVRKFFPNQDPIGKHFGIDHTQYSSAFEIVGVCADFKMTDPRGEVRAVFLRPLAQQFSGFKEPDMIEAEKGSMYVSSIILNFTMPQRDAEAQVRNTLAIIDPNLTVIRFASLDSQVAFNFNQDRLIARLTSLFGFLALTLASVGLYGVMSYFVNRRTGEIGIRMALGATRSNVLTMVLRGAVAQILMGTVLGIPAALFAGHLIASQLYGVGAYDPYALAGAVLTLGLCSGVAGFIPARRAASLEPMEALRTE